MAAPRPGATAAQSELTIADVMRTDFRSCNAGTPVAEVAAALSQSRLSLLPVTRAQEPIGVVTGDALAAALAERGGDLSRLTAGDLMRPEPPTIPIGAPIREAADRLAGEGGFLLAVNPEGLLKGVVTFHELGPRLSDTALTRLVGRLAGGATPPAVAARTADPTAEVKAAKSQAQAHPWDSPTGAHPEPVPLLTPADVVNPLLKVSDAMTAAPRTCSPHSSVLEAALIFREADCGAIAVTEDGRPVGVLTDRDVALALPGHEADLAGTPVGALMTKEPVTIEADAALGEAVGLLEERGVRRLLVVDSGGRLAGVLSWTDLVPHLSERGLGRVVSGIVRHR